MISKAYLRGYVQHQPEIDKAWVVEHAEGLIVLSGVRWRWGARITQRQPTTSRRCRELYQTHFADHFYLEFIHSRRADEESHLHFALDVAEQYDSPGVATNEVVFITEESFEAHEIRVAIHDGYTLEDPRRPKITVQSCISAAKRRCESRLQTFQKR